jgi:hypothetical protein
MLSCKYFTCREKKKLYYFQQLFMLILSVVRIVLIFHHKGNNIGLPSKFNMITGAVSFFFKRKLTLAANNS